MEDPFEDIAFLAASRNRVAVLDVLADRPHDRHALQDELDVSQPTASRILRDLREREWVTRTGDEYAPTPVGEFVIAAFADLQEQFETIHHLREVVPQLREQGFDFDLSRLRSADVVRFAAGSSRLAMTHEVAQIEAADRVRIVTDSAPRESVEAAWRQVTREGQSFEAVIERGTVAEIRRDPDLARWHRDVLASERARLYRYEGDAAGPIVVTDDRVNLALPAARDDGGAWISTTDEEVFAWAEATFEDHRDRAEPLTEEDLSERA